jgi:hypothetical protein
VYLDNLCNENQLDALFILNLFRQVSGMFIPHYLQVFTVYEACSKKDRTFALKTLLLILQHFKHCLPQSSPLYWQYTVPVSSIFGMRPGTHFL